MGGEVHESRQCDSSGRQCWRPRPCERGKLCLTYGTGAIAWQATP